MIHPLFKWFGSKWQSGRHYPAPIHDRVYEPFAGGAGYALNHHTKQVRIYDSDPNLTVLWTWLINEATSDDIRQIPINVPEGTDIRTLGLSTGQAMLLKHWQRTNNVGDCWTISPWGNKPGQWTANTRARVAEESQAIKHWEFGMCGTALPTGTWFIDPPYQYNYRYRATSSPIDYQSLGAAISCGVHGQVIVCEALCPKTGARPDWLEFQDFRRTVTSRRKAEQSHHSSELIYYQES